MFRFSPRTIARAAAVALASASILVVAGASPAFALCKYGSPNCVNPRPNFDFQVEETVTLDSVSDGWVDQDCRYYGNCLPDNQEEEDRARCQFNNNCEQEAGSARPQRVQTLDRSLATGALVRQR